MTDERKFTLVCVGLSIVIFVLIGVFESPAAAIGSGVSILLASLLGVGIGRLIKVARRRMGRQPELSPVIRSTGSFVRLGLIIGAVIAAGLVGLSLAGGADDRDVTQIVAAALPPLIVMPLAFWAMGWLANRKGESN